MHQTMMVAAILSLVSAAISLLLTRLLLRLLPRWGMVDKPDFKRHIHSVAIPRGGGLGAILAFVVVVILFFGGIMHERGELFLESIRFLSPLVILIPLGICDDKWGLSAKTKFLFQIGAAVMAWMLGFRLTHCFGFSMPQWL